MQVKTGLLERTMRLDVRRASKHQGVECVFVTLFERREIHINVDKSTVRGALTM